MAETTSMKKVLTLLAVVTVLAACESHFQSPDVTTVDPKTGKTSTKTGVKQIEVGTLKTFPDIPIPATHKINMEQTLIFNSTHQTIGRLVTEGRGDIASIFQFYQENMTANGWNLVNGFQSSTSSLYFAKPGRFAAILIEPSGNGTKVTANIGPEQ